MSLFILIIIFILLVIDAVAKSIELSRWFVTTIVMIVLVGQILALNYECKFLLELENVNDPSTYFAVTTCMFISLYYQDLV